MSDYYTKPSNPSDGDVAYASDVANVNNETDAAFTRVSTAISQNLTQVSAAQAWAVGPSGERDTLVPTAYGGNGINEYCSEYYSNQASVQATSAASYAAIATGSLASGAIITDGTGVTIATSGAPPTATISADFATVVAVSGSTMTGDLIVSGGAANKRTEISESSVIVKYADTASTGMGFYVSYPGVGDVAMMEVDYKGDGTVGMTDEMTVSAGANLTLVANTNQLRLDTAASGNFHPLGLTTNLGKNDASNTWNEGYYLGTLNDISDERLKEKIKSLDSNDVDWLYDLRPVEFKWKNKVIDPNDDYRWGFIAQEVFAEADKKAKKTKHGSKKLKKKEHPDDPDDYHWAVSRTELIPGMLKLIQDQKAQIDDLTARIEALEGA